MMMMKMMKVLWRVLNHTFSIHKGAQSAHTSEQMSLSSAATAVLCDVAVAIMHYFLLELSLMEKTLSRDSSAR